MVTRVDGSRATDIDWEELERFPHFSPDEQKISNLHSFEIVWN